MRQVLPYAAVGLVVIAIAVFGLWVLSGLTATRPAADTGTSAQATVIRTASCASATPNDALTARVDGRPMNLLLNGCGNSPGTKVTVLVPANATANTVVSSSSAAPGTASGLSHRVAFLLLVVSAAAGGGFAYLLYRHRSEPSADAARPPARFDPQARFEPLPADEPSSPVANSETTGTNWFEDSAVREPLNTQAAQENADKS